MPFKLITSHFGPFIVREQAIHITLRRLDSTTHKS